jgi:Cdc6-like AAA superfamily ATPase
MNWIKSITRWFAEMLGLRSRAPIKDEPEYVWRPAAAPEAGEQQSSLGDVFAAIRTKLRRAYTPAQPVTDRKMYSGRSRVLSQVIQAIEDQGLHAVIYGERGLGKTSTLHVLAQAARDAKYLIVYLTCSEGSTFDEMFRALAVEIPLLFHGDFGPTSQRAERRESFAAILGPEPVNARLASEILAKVTGVRVLVILDEFDRAESEVFRLGIAELIKGLSDRAAAVQLLIGGVAANLSELIANIPSIQRNIFALQLPKMTADEVRDLVKNGEAVSGVTFDDPAIAAITVKALGFPYIASLLAHRSAMTAIDNGRVVVGPEDVTAAMDHVVEEFKARVSRRSLTVIDHCAHAGLLPALGALGGVAQTVGGWFAPLDIGPQHADAAEIPGLTEVLEKLAKERLLVETRQEDFGVVYHFFEESVPPYLWLAAGRAADAGPGPPPAPQADAHGA